jgi:hypothetical protein
MICLSWSTIRTALIVLVVGVPLLAFLAVLTEGAILLPLEGVVILAPLIALHYLLWGWSMRKQPPGEEGRHRERTQQGSGA